MRLRLLAVVALCLVCVLYARATSHITFGDFRAFYCAAKVAGSGADPYRVHPLYECETQPSVAGFYRAERGVTIPAPLPGYALALLLPFTLFPFEAAAVAFAALMLAAACVAVFALARITSRPADAVAVALVLSLGLVSITLGQILPLCIAALCVAALYAARGRSTAASIAVACAMIEPHIALPAALALFVWMPRARVPLVACAAVLMTLSLLFLGPAINLEYLASVLPAQAYSEITHDSQYGISAVLYQLGVGERTSMLFGELSFFAALALGVFLAGPVSRRLGAAALVLVPVAIGIVGSPYMHLAQIGAAIPTAFFLASQTSRYRITFTIATALLAVPWQTVGIFPILVPCAAAVAGMVVWEFESHDLALAFRAALASAVTGALVVLLTVFASSHAIAPRPPEVRLDASLPQASWAGEVRSKASNANVALLGEKLPTWAGLCLVILGVVWLVADKDDERLVAVETLPLRKRRESLT